MAPLERAARALCKLDGNPENATMDGKPLWRDYLPEVRVVLLAIREPSEAMLKAGDEAAWEYSDLNDGQPAISNVFPAMIDAALKE